MYGNYTTKLTQSETHHDDIVHDKDLIQRIRLLRINCVLLNNAVQRKLLTSGICKRYTRMIDNLAVFNGDYQMLKQENFSDVRQRIYIRDALPDIQSNYLAQKTNSSQIKCIFTQSEQTTSVKGKKEDEIRIVRPQRPELVVRKRILPDSSVFSATRQTLKAERSPELKMQRNGTCNIPPDHINFQGIKPSTVSATISNDVHRRKGPSSLSSYNENCRRTASSRRHADCIPKREYIPLVTSSSSTRPTTSQSVQPCRSTHKRHSLSNRTVPRPFRFTKRKSVGCFYSQRFLQQMLEEKSQRELKELQKFSARFVANPIPSTTYIPDAHFYIGKLKRSTSASAITKRNTDANSIDKPKKRKCFRHNPVPLSTYIRPSKSADDARKMERHRRAVEMLVGAAEPRGMTDHSVRWRIQNEIRHNHRCLPQQQRITFRRSTVPDFVRLHATFEDQLRCAYRYRAPTMIAPFHFDTGPLHYCWNWSRRNASDYCRIKRRNERCAAKKQPLH